MHALATVLVNTPHNTYAKWGKLIFGIYKNIANTLLLFCVYQKAAKHDLLREDSCGSQYKSTTSPQLW